MRFGTLSFAQRGRPYLIVAGVAIGAVAAACAPEGDEMLHHNASGNSANEADGGDGPIPGGTLPDEQFPAALLEPYSGADLDEYDDTIVSYAQLRARIDRVFADTKLGGDTNKFFSDKLSLLGGADFVNSFAEARVATPDFLLGMDGLAKEACSRAATNKTGPFAGADPTASGNDVPLVTQLYQKILFRNPSAAEVTSTTGLLTKLVPLAKNRSDAFAGVCEGLVRHPDFLFTLPPSVNSTSGAEQEKMRTVKLALDFVGRPPTDAEFGQLAGKSIPDKLDYFFGTPEFRDFFFHRARLRTETNGTDDGDEPARLWTSIAVNGAPMQDLLFGDYTVDKSYAKQPRDATHGKSGILTMTGFVSTKPGLPHFNYAARVMSDYMGQVFEVTPAIVASRLPAESTTDPSSSCIGCHGVLTPLEHQRAAWADDGTYQPNDPTGKPIDDSDQNLVPDYPYKGKGMEGFATLAVRKEKFFRQSFQALFLFYMGRQMRYDQDERTTYLTLWKSAFDQKGDIREQMKILAQMPTYLGQ